jgi:tetratricopeptide (TPR) repeat protein
MINKADLLNTAKKFYENKLYKDAIKVSRNILKIYPGDDQANQIIAFSHYYLGDINQAIVLLKKIIKKNNGDKYLALDLARILIEAGKHLEAKKILDEYIDDTDFAFKYEYARACALNNEMENALKNYLEIEEKLKNNSDLIFNIGLIYEKINQFKLAEDYYIRAINDSDHIGARFNLGVLYQEQNKIDMSIQCFEKVLERVPNNSNARYYLGNIYLYQKEFSKGWNYYSCRWDVAGFNSKKQFSDEKKWNGKDENIDLLIWAEQGIGDQILYSTIFNDLLKSNNRITVSVDKRLINIFSATYSQIKFISSSDNKQENFDQHLPMADLGLHYRNHISLFPKENRKLNISNVINQEIISQLDASKPICGLSWRSNNSQVGSEKSVALRELLPLIENCDFNFVSLQYGDVNDELIELNQQLPKNKKVIHFNQIDYTNDIDVVFSLLKICKSVVTVSNTIAHMSGILGLNTYLMLPYSKGKFWYWHEHEGRNLWYPSVKPIEQISFGDWCTTVKKIQQNLTNDLSRKN